MACNRKAKWFVVVALTLSCWMGAVASPQGVAEAGVIGSHLADATGQPQDLQKVQSFLEHKLVVQKLVDYGVTPEQALAKVQGMSSEDLHRLASLTDRAAVGADGGGLITLLVAIIFIIVILKLLNKAVIR